MYCKEIPKIGHIKELIQQTYLIINSYSSWSSNMSVMMYFDKLNFILLRSYFCEFDSYVVINIDALFVTLNLSCLDKNTRQSYSIKLPVKPVLSKISNIYLTDYIFPVINKLKQTHKKAKVSCSSWFKLDMNEKSKIKIYII